MKKLVSVPFLLAALAGCLRAQDATPQAGFAPLGDARLYYETVGTGPAVVLVHGGMGDLHYWDEQVDALSQTYRVIRYDSRSFGRSSLPVEGQSHSDAEEVAAVLDHLGIQRAHVVGFSRGSRTAIDFALLSPDRTESIALVGPIVSGYTSASVTEFYERLGRCNELRASQDREAVVNCYLESPFGGSAGGPETIARVREIMTFDHPFWTSTVPVRREAPPAVDRTTEIAVPTLIVTADRDLAFCKETAEYLEATVAQAEKIVLSDVGHFILLESPERLNQALLNFLASH
jgi:3-oxoadipate enol-lactonase